MITNFSHIQNEKAMYDKMIFVEDMLVDGDSKEEYVQAMAAMRGALDVMMEKWVVCAGLSERVVLEAMTEKFGNGQTRPNLFGRIYALEKYGKIRHDTAEELHNIRKAGNDAVHYGEDVRGISKDAAYRKAEQMYEQIYRASHYYAAAKSGVAASAGTGSGENTYQTVPQGALQGMTAGKNPLRQIGLWGYIWKGFLWSAIVAGIALIFALMIDDDLPIIAAVSIFQLIWFIYVLEHDSNVKKEQERYRQVMGLANAPKEYGLWGYLWRSWAAGAVIGLLGGLLIGASSGDPDMIRLVAVFGGLYSIIWFIIALAHDAGIRKQQENWRWENAPVGANAGYANPVMNSAAGAAYVAGDSAAPNGAWLYNQHRQFMDQQQQFMDQQQQLMNQQQHQQFMDQMNSDMDDFNQQQMDFMNDSFGCGFDSGLSFDSGLDFGSGFGGMDFGGGMGFGGMGV